MEEHFKCDIVKLVTMASDGLHIVWKDTFTCDSLKLASYHGIQWIAYSVERHFTCGIAKLVTMASDGLHIMWKGIIHTIL